MAFALVLMGGLAVWRITHMIWTERGPLDIFSRLRAYLATKQKHAGGMYDMISCFNCLSIWVAVLPALLASSIIVFLMLVPVLSAIAMVVNQIFYKLK
jgi:hypothetical protein